ncbi:type II secretion system protein GspL [Pseudomonadota bacterium]
MILYFQADPPHRWALVDRRGSVVEDGISESPEDIPVLKKTSTTAAVVAGGKVTVHEVETPAKSRSKAMASAPYILEERLATNVDDLEFTILDFDAGQRVRIAVVDKGYLEGLQSSFAGLHLSLDAVVPEYFLVPLHHQARYSLARIHDGRYALRHGAFDGMNLDENTLEYWWQSLHDPNAAVAVNDVDVARRLIEWGGTSISVWEIGTEFPDWLRHGNTSLERVNVMGAVGSAGRREGPSVLMKVAMVVFGIGMLARVGVDLYDNFILYRQNANLEREIVKVFHEAFPDERRIVNPRLQLEQRINELRTGAVDGGAFQTILSSLAAAVPGVNATVDEISFRDDFLLVTCTTADFAGLDKLKARFSANKNVKVELISSGSRDNKVSARFRLESA